MSRPERIRDRIGVTGLAGGETLISIDFRPSNGNLYALGNTSRLYVIDSRSGAARAVSSTPFTPSLEGTSFGFDFNPVVDLIRVVSNTGQNLRLNPDTGAVVGNDNRLIYSTCDVANAGISGSAVGAAYINPDNDSTTGTVLYDIDPVRDVLATQNPPNAGTLNTVGALGVDVSEVAGFDIALFAGNFEGIAVMQINGSSVSRLYAIDLASGRARERGVIGDGTVVITGLAIPRAYNKARNSGRGGSGR